MTVHNLLEGVFSRKRLKRAPNLSPYTMDHSQSDEYIHDELRVKSTRFDEALKRCPEVDIDLTDDDGNTSVTRKRIDAAEGLNSDMWFGFHDERDRPQTMPDEKIRPSRQFFKEVMEGMIESDDFKSARSRTRGDDVGSVLAMMAAQDTLDEALKGVLKEHLERAQKMDQLEQTIRDRPHPSPNPDGTSGPPSPERMQQLKDAAQAARDARQQLGQLAEQQQASGQTQAVAQAIEQMAEAGKDAAEAWGNLPGNGIGQRLNMPPDQAIELARKWMEHDSPRRVAELMGRFERDFRFKRSTRVVGGREIPIDVELGNDLTKILTSELLQLAIPEMRGLVAAKYVNKQMLQYEMVGSTEAGKGPIIMCIDFSGSMGGERHIWAKATALSLLAIAQMERRAVHVIAFTGGIIGEWDFPPSSAPSLDDAFEFSALSPTGGTHPFPATSRAEELLNQQTFRQADIVIITDGECSFGEEDLEQRARLEAKGVRIHGISVDCNVTRYLASMCSEVIPVYDMTAPSDATDMLVQTVV